MICYSFRASPAVLYLDSLSPHVESKMKNCYFSRPSNNSSNFHFTTIAFHK